MNDLAEPMLPADADAIKLVQVEKNKRNYVRKSAKRMVKALATLVRNHNPALSVTSTVIPESQTMRVHFTLGTVKLQTRHVASIDGHLDVLWGHDENGRGKEIALTGSSYVAAGVTKTFSKQNLRDYRTTAHALFAQLLEQELPLRRRGEVVAAWKEAQSREYRPRPDRSAEGRVRAKRTILPLEEYGPHQRDFLYKAARNFGRNMRNRYCQRHPIFSDIDVSYLGETNRMSIVLHTAKGMNNGNPIIRLEGSIDMFWQSGGGAGTRVYFTPDTGLHLPAGVKAERIDICKRTDASAGLFNMILASGAIKHAQELAMAPDTVRHFRNAYKDKKPSTRRMLAAEGRGDFYRRDNKGNTRHRLQETLIGDLTP